MLHKVNVPLCRTHLMWVVELQHRLLQALCDEHVDTDDINIAWVSAYLVGVPADWITTFCGRHKGKRKELTLISCMQAIAHFDAHTKTTLLTAFRHDLQVLDEIEQGVRPARTMQSIKELNRQQQIIVNTFFQIFYDPTLYADNGKGGYRIPQVDGGLVVFHKDVFLEQYKDINEAVRVCPLCDGQRGLVQLDHFYPKSHYPFLSCHPLNLIPICKDCNMFPCKGEKQPLDHRKATNQMDEWFHPIFEPLANWSDTTIHPNNRVFRVEFQRFERQTTPVPKSDDERIEKRLTNLDSLINLKNRWRDELSHQSQSLIRIIREFRRAHGRGMTDEELSRRLRAMAEDAKINIGIEPLSILKHHYLQAVERREENVFRELRIVNSNGDAVDG